jgi:phosphoglycerate kinase
MITVNNFNFKDKKAIIRVDFNVPQDENLKVTDNTRIVAAKPTIDKILNDGGSVILMTHLGRPKGGFEDKYSLKHIVNEVSTVLGQEVVFVEDCIGTTAENAISNLQPKQIALLENLRFYKEEEAGDNYFASKLARLGDIYVNDAFGTAHRAHASTAIIANFYPKNKCFGLLMAKELESINKVLKSDDKPVTAIIGGSKVSSKITIIENMLPAVDNLIIGGGMAYTFVKAKGGKIGNSICEDDYLETALQIIDAAVKNNVTIYLPSDTLAADAFDNNANTQVVPTNEIPDNWQGLDVGPATSQLFDEVIQNSKTILWNGPVGVFELETFKKGTMSIAHAIEKATKNGSFSLVGGGDSVAFVKQNHFEDKVSYVSTGGGAMLESLEGKTLPGVAAILA